MMDSLNTLERVISGLQCKLNEGGKRGCSDCPYDEDLNCLGCDAMLRDALTLLKALEPRLVTKDDFNGADEYGWLPAWCEERAGGKVYCECILVDALKENGVRYWTGKPSDEQRENTKWE